MDDVRQRTLPFAMCLPGGPSALLSACPLELLSCDCTRAVELGFKSLFLRLADKRSPTHGAANSCRAPGTLAGPQEVCSWGLGLPWGSPSFSLCRTDEKWYFITAHRCV